MKYCYQNILKEKNSQIRLEKSFEIHMSKGFFSRESKRIYNVSHETFLLRLKFFSLVGLKYFLEIFCFGYLQYKLHLFFSRKSNHNLCISLIFVYISYFNEICSNSLFPIILAVDSYT